jgi:hypothetical protein
LVLGKNANFVAENRDHNINPSCYNVAKLTFWPHPDSHQQGLGESQVGYVMVNE